jgi:hypothetical protein
MIFGNLELYIRTKNIDYWHSGINLTLQKHRLSQQTDLLKNKAKCLKTKLAEPKKLEMTILLLK